MTKRITIEFSIVKAYFAICINCRNEWRSQEYLDRFLWGEHAQEALERLGGE